MTDIEKALAELMAATERLPFSQAIHDLHGAFRELANSGYLIPRASWLNAFELAAIAKWVYLHGHRGRANPIDWPFALNRYKDLWRATEASASYPDDPAVIVSFALRFVYQQVVWNIASQKMNANFARARGIFGANCPRAHILKSSFENATQINFEEFLKIAHVMYGLFLQQSTLPDHLFIGALHERLKPEAVSSALRVLSATRRKFKKYYDTCAATAASEAVYEFNPLLRYPILFHEDHYSCVFPELINYAATRGIYFLIADSVGADFNAAFADAFEAYVSGLCISALGHESVVTESQERESGWHGKTNDVSVIADDFSMLIECKNSGLFSVSKRSADPSDLLADIRKNLANADKRKGLFQLYDKIKAARGGQLPASVQAKFAGVTRFYPVLLLHDEIWFANRPEVLKNLIDAELERNGIAGFDYQIWHVEELELLLRAVPRQELGHVLQEKFTNPKFRSLDLTAYLSGRYGLGDLRIHLFLPVGDSKAMRIIRPLAGC